MLKWHTNKRLISFRNDYSVYLGEALFYSSGGTWLLGDTRNLQRNWTLPDGANDVGLAFRNIIFF